MSESEYLIGLTQNERRENITVNRKFINKVVKCGKKWYIFRYL